MGQKFIEIKNSIENFLDMSRDAREDMSNCQNFYDGKQWTEEEKQELKKRYQFPVVDNKIREKVNGRLGYYKKRKTSIKAFPRNKTIDSKSASLISKAIDAVGDENNLSSLKYQALKELDITGLVGFVIDFDKNKKFNIKLRLIKYDRIIYDLRSECHLLSDAQFKGGLVWLDEGQIKERYPKANLKNITPQDTFDSYDYLTQDKPIWEIDDDNRKRYLIAEYYYKEKGDWYRCVICGNDYLEKPAKSIFVDDEGNSICPFIIGRLNIDGDNNAYGDILNDIWMQKELNARRSKALHYFASRQTKSIKGAIDDIEELKDELAKPNGHVELKSEIGNFDIIPTNDMAGGQLELYKDAKEYFNTAFTNGNMAGDQANAGTMSGHAIHLLQSGSALSKEYIFEAHDSLMRTVYEYIWYAIKQSWTEETYIRIFDDANAIKFLGFNVPMTAEAHIREQLEDPKVKQEDKIKMQKAYQYLSQINPQALQQVVYVKNDLGNMLVDVTLEVSNSTELMQEMQFRFLMENADKTGLDVTELLQFSGFEDKYKIIDMINERRQVQAQQQQAILQAQQQAMQLDMAKKQAEIQKENSVAQLNNQKAFNVALDNQAAAQNGGDLERVNDLLDIELKGKEIEQKQIENLTAMLAPLDKNPQVVV